MQTVNFNYSVDVAHIVNLMSVFLTNHLSLVFLFVSYTRSHPKQKAPKEQLVAFSKDGILFQQNSEIRRCFGWRPCTNLFPTSHPETRIVDDFFHRFIMGCRSTYRPLNTTPPCLIKALFKRWFPLRRSA